MPQLETIRSPFNGAVAGTVPVADAQRLDAAIAAAVAAAPKVAAMPRHERQAILRRVVDGLRANLDRLVDTMIAESGKPRRYARIEVERAISTFSIAGDEVTRPSGELLPLDIVPSGVGYTAIATRVPIGVIGAIAPFNFPLNLVAHKLAPAIAVGNPVVLKAPPQAPLCAHELGRIVHEAGWPADALAVFHAPVDVAQALATDERIAMLSFTGSAAVGWHLKSIAGKKRVALELGGNAAAIVASDADLAWAAKRCALGAFAQSGQVCIKVQRIFIERAVYDAFVQAFLDETDPLGVGDPADDATIVGPIIDERSADRIMAWIADAVDGGATVLRGNVRRASIIEPTVLADVTRAMKVDAEEIFGPVVTLAPVDNVTEAIARANDTRYGLQAGIFTNDVRTIGAAFDGLRVGGVIANDYPTLRIDNFPYGGVKDSGFGREGVRYAMDEMSEFKTLVVKYR